MILNEINWDNMKHCQYEFGSYVQASQVNNPANKNLAHTVDAIYLCPTTNIQGGHELMDIDTERLITQPKVYPRVMTKIFIKAVEKPAESLGFKKIKKINRKKKEILLPDAYLLAGVYWVHDDNKTDDIKKDENK